MRLSEISKKEFKDKLCQSDLETLREIQAKVEATDIGILGWKTELRDNYESRITGEPPPTLYIYRTKAGTSLRDMDRVFLQPIMKDYDVEPTMRDHGRVEYRVRTDRPTNCEVDEL